MASVALPEFAVLGALLVVAALISTARQAVLSLTTLAVLAGFALGDGGLRVLDFRGQIPLVQGLVTGALIVILFRDGLLVDEELVRSPGAWHMPLRKLVFATAGTALITAAAAHFLIGLGWTPALLLGAVLAPTDVVLSSPVIADPRVPRETRHSLTMESGLNDGVALPFVLIFIALLQHGHGHFIWWQFLLRQLVVGVGSGALIGYIASRLMPTHGQHPDHARSLYALGVALIAYSLTAGVTGGNGLIAVFVAAMVLGVRRRDLSEAVDRRADDLVEVLKLAVFVIFGALLTGAAMFYYRLAAAAFAAAVLLLARPLAVFGALLGTRRADRPNKAFMAWFGPRGVASMAYALLLLTAGLRSAPRLFGLAGLVIFCSILLHGVTAAPGVRWIGRRQRGRQPDPMPATPAGEAPEAER